VKNFRRVLAFSNQVLLDLKMQIFKSSFGFKKWKFHLKIAKICFFGRLK